MDIIYINSKNIKISLSREELYENGLNAETLDYAKTGTKRFLWELLDEAYIKTGFDAGNARLFVRVFPSTDGGCELFVTKKSYEKHGYEIKTQYEMGFFCIVPDAELLFQLCERLKTARFHGASALYYRKDEENAESFILFCRPEPPRLPSYICRSAASKAEPTDTAIFKNMKGGRDFKDYAFCAEYGKIFPATPELYAYLDEHCTILCAKDAVSAIAR